MFSNRFDTNRAVQLQNGWTHEISDLESRGIVLSMKLLFSHMQRQVICYKDNTVSYVIEDANVYHAKNFIFHFLVKLSWLHVFHLHQRRMMSSITALLAKGQNTESKDIRNPWKDKMHAFKSGSLLLWSIFPNF